ncbi:HD-GYP domain-containing protein [Magnetococcus sp. PR-3]|uniref:HD-GYP domain-containing protein n=1 Tax=Magnetococcus sp. PR-3 TaxID=3120355 RepID=UPI002FCE3050
MHRDKANQEISEQELMAQIQALGETPSSDISTQPLPSLHKRWNHLQEASSLVVKAKSAVSQAIQHIRQEGGVDILSMRQAVQGMVTSIIEDELSLLTLSTLTRKHDRIFSHSMNVAVYLMALYKRQGKSEQEIQDIGVIGLRHDIGYAKLPDEIANLNRPSNKQEALLRRSHVDLSVVIMQRHSTLKPELADVVAQHHEHLDGSGYPKALKAQQISWVGRASAIVDAYDSYNATHSKQVLQEPKAGLRFLLKLSETKYDRTIVESFIQCIGVYPVGTIVQLAGGSIGIVALINRDTLLHPVIRVVQDRGQAPLTSENLVNLADFQNQKNYTIVKELPHHALPHPAQSYLPI